jgi:hypothetical protein
MFKDVGICTEKVLPEKIKSIIWNKEIEVIIVNCGSYYEIHRIGYKHEVIFKKEEVIGIVDILFIENELVGVVLRDSSLYFINIGSCEIILKTKIHGYKGGSLFNRNANVSIKNLNDCPISKDVELTISNPFAKDVNFISFSKIDVLLVQFLQNNCSKPKTFNYIYNKETNEVDFCLMMLIPIAKYRFTTSILYLDKLSHDEMVYITREEGICINKLSIKHLEDSHLLTIIYQLTYATHMVDFIQNILAIFNKIIYKLGLTLFDKYIFSNKLEHLVDTENDASYKSRLCKELKELLSLGTINDNLKELLKDLFEARTIIKMDENIYFNLKNIEDIMTDNIKPAINCILYYIDEVKSLEIIDDNVYSDIRDKYILLFMSFEQFFSQIVETKIQFRNFLAWINMFNTQPQTNEIVKSHLTNYIIDYKGLQKFIDLQGYNLTVLINLMEKDETESKTIKKEVKRESNLLTNNLISSYLNQNNLEALCLEAVGDEPQIRQNDISMSIKTRLFEIKDKLNILRGQIIQYLSNNITSYPIMMINSLNEIGKVCVNRSILLLKITANQILLINLKDNLTAYIELGDSIVLDYDLDSCGNMYILRMLNNTISIVKSKLTNYSYIKQNCLEISSLTRQVLKIDSQLDLESSEITNLLCGYHGLISTIENRKNKISIIKL